MHSKIKVVITYFDLGKDYHELLKMAFASAKHFGCETVLVTSTDIRAGQDATLYVPHPGENVLMQAILDAQKAYIDSALFDSNSVLFSPDALVARHLGQVFDKDFDLGVTQGTTMDYPINNGVIYIRPETKDRLSLLWSDFIARCNAYPDRYQRWYGDQKAMQEVISEANDMPYGLKIQRLLSRFYNASLSNKREWCASDDLMLHSAYVIHFKGMRKSQMASYYGKICQS